MEMNTIDNLIYLGFAIAYLTIMYTGRKKLISSIRSMIGND